MSDATTSNKVDPYGFERPDNFDYDIYNDFMAHYLSVLAKRSQKWEQHFRKHLLAKSKVKKLKKYIRKGVPSAHRTDVWMLVSGAEARWRQQPDLYRSLLNSRHDPELVEMIKSDIPRTFPDNIFFQDAPSDPNAKRLPLYHVLIALAHKNQRVGYCQGLNFIAGLLLLLVRQEEKVFWLMDTLLNNILPDYYSRDMFAMKVDQAVLGDLVRRYYPDVADHMEKEGLSWAIVSTKWFICLYADVIPIETLLRIWDCLFREGSTVLLRVALAMVAENRTKILNCVDFTELVTVFKVMTCDSHATNCHKFMKHVFRTKVKRSKIEKLRNRHWQLLKDEARK